MRKNKSTTASSGSFLGFVRRNIAPLFAGVVALSASLLIGCEDRGNPVFPASPPAGIDSWSRVHLFTETRFSQFGDLPTTAIRVYTPPGYLDKSLGRPYPVLYMLSPFNGDQFFYLQHGMQVVMDRLIAEGTIEPMIVVSVNASSNAFGGSFYGNMVTNGNYMGLVSNSLPPFIDTLFNTFGNLNLSFVDTTIDTTIDTLIPDTIIDTTINIIQTADQLRSNLRGISGYEMGGYGAFRAALTSGLGDLSIPSEFGSVSTISAPLSFTDPMYGYQNLFDDMINEWGSFDAIDTSFSTPISNYLITAAIGFSPEDTAYAINGVNPFNVDFIYKITDSSTTDSTFVANFETTIVSIDTTLNIFITLIDTTLFFDTTVVLDTIFDSSFIDTFIDSTFNTMFDSTYLNTLVLGVDTLIFNLGDTLIDTVTDTIIGSTFTPDTVVTVLINPIDTLVDTMLVSIDTTLDTTFLIFPGDTTFDFRSEDTIVNYDPPTGLTFPAVPRTSTGEDNILRIFLPFDSTFLTTGQPYDSIWPLWQNNDMPNILNAVSLADPTVLPSFSGKMLIMATRDAKFEHFNQSRIFSDTLNMRGYLAQFVEYAAYDGFADENGARYLFEVWPTLLKFHSDQFHPFIPTELQVQNYQMGF